MLQVGHIVVSFRCPLPSSFLAVKPFTHKEPSPPVLFLVHRRVSRSPRLLMSCMQSDKLESSDNLHPGLGRPPEKPDPRP
jgi:hypothetical protein